VPARTQTQGTVLVLDDDQDLRETLSEWLGATCGVQSVIAASLDEIQQKQDAVLGCFLAFLDINLGAGKPSGLDAHRWLRERGFKGRIAFLTGHAQSHPHAIAAAQLTDSQVLAKPVELSVLRSLVEDSHVG
jgi:FixJ family two-component response regulator